MRNILFLYILFFVFVLSVRVTTAQSCSGVTGNFSVADGCDPNQLACVTKYTVKSFSCTPWQTPDNCVAEVTGMACQAAVNGGCVTVPVVSHNQSCGGSGSGSCGGVRNSCSGTCGPGSSCRAPANPANGNACSCHPSGGNGDIGIETPGGLNNLCPQPGTTATLSWDLMNIAEYYNITVDDQSNPWAGCGVNPGDFCVQVLQPNSGPVTYTFSTVPGHSYGWFVQGVTDHCNTCSNWGHSQIASSSFECFAANAPPLPVSLTITNSDGVNVPFDVGLTYPSNSSCATVPTPGAQKYYERTDKKQCVSTSFYYGVGYQQCDFPTHTCQWNLANVPALQGITTGECYNSLTECQAANRNQICKIDFQSASNPRGYTFNLVLTDPDGGNDITAAQIRWNGVIKNLTLGTPAGLLVTGFVTGDDTAATGPIQVNMLDSGGWTGWLNVPYTWKVWNCNVPVSGSIYDGSAGQACPATGFSVPANSAMGFSSLVYSNVTGGANVVGTVNSSSSFGSNNLIWGQSYLPFINGGNALNPEGNLVASGRFTRVIDLGTGNTICPSSTQIGTSSIVDPYLNTIGMKLDLSHVQTQEGWWQGKGVDLRAGGSVASGVPLVAATTFLIDNLAIGSSNNGLVAGSSFSNISGWNDNSQYGSPNNWYLNRSFIDSHKYSYQSFYQDFFVKLGEGVTGVTTIDSGTTGIMFVDGDLNINSDITVAPNDYLMIIVNGNINIGVGASKVEGILVANNGITALGNVDDQLNINGVLYVGRNSNIRLARSFNNKAINNTTPATVVNYRPDIVLSLPGKLSKVLSGWRED